MSQSTDTMGVSIRTGKRSFWSQEWVIRSVTVVGFLIIFVAMQFWLTQGFFVAGSRVLNIHQNVPVLLLATAAVVGLLGGAFDLSIAGNATLSAFLTVGLTSRQGWPLPVVLALVLLMGCLVGFRNAFIVTTLGVNVIIATLGMGSVLLGASAVFGGGAVVSSSGHGPLPEWFLAAGAYTSKLPFPAQLAILVLAAVALFFASARLRQPRFLPGPWGLWRGGVIVVLLAAAYLGLGLQAWLNAASVLVGIFIIILLIVWTIMDRTVGGRSIKATGANPIAARLAGVRTTKETYRAFAITGVLSSLAGIVIAANQGSASPNVAGGFLLPAFAAAYLSTVVFSAGRFTVLGTALGGILVVWVAQGLIESGLNFTWTDVVNGGVLIIAVSLSTLLRRRLT